MGARIMKAHEQFENVIIAVFGRQFLEEINELYQHVRESAGKGEYNEFGGDSLSIALMLPIRAAMRQKGLAPVELPNFSNLERFYESRTELLKQTLQFQCTFPKTWEFDCEIKCPNRGYAVDGWDYENEEAIEFMSEEGKASEWIFRDSVSGKLTHYYYNELDHYLTYLVGAIRRFEYANDIAKECGIFVLKYEIGKILQGNDSGV